ncbi:hypothetical protein DFH07DRAFT_784330 [Mycena maculata]|uniref:CxC2-like cysteine cluster KDZ transposase-associated domain-containing protein n=1 Tax=Mycena maculata TaxID=230809 RepID=A0AAD7HH56_9AGAR|nr:hypothetical protein DFH07DRAFT_784330 [Mycena maculata]
MRRLGGRKVARRSVPDKSVFATSVPTYKVTFHTNGSAPKTEEHYVDPASGSRNNAVPLDTAPEMSVDVPPDGPFFPFLDTSEEASGAIPAYETTTPCDEKGETKTRQSVNHMNELKAQEAVFLRILLSLHYSSQLLTPCRCGTDKHVRKVGCSDCMQPELLCRQCWVNKHRTMPTHWALVWNATECFFEKYDFCRVMKNSSIGLGHYGAQCPDADLAHTFTLVDRNGIHATALTFCRCKTSDGQRGAPEFQQLLQAGIFPGSVTNPKMGYTLGLLEYYRQMRSQGKGSAYNFVRVLQRMADPFFSGSVPTDRPYPNRPLGHLGLQCAACPERGVNMPLLVNVPRYLLHLISQFNTLDGNFKANLFFKRDDGSDIALTDGKMYFPRQAEFEAIARTYVIPEEDKEVPCKAHIGAIRHQGQVKYGNTALSGVIASACDHTVVGSFVDMIKGEAFALGTYAQREHARHTNSPPHGPATATPTVFSYDSWCSFVINMVKRAIALFPETWLHTLLAMAEGQIPADHINGHGVDCQALWQAVYFACRGHFHGETAEMLWAFLNPLGSSTRQMTGAARHDIINFVIDAWNTLKVLRQAELLAEEQLDALCLFELHMAVVEDLSRQHATEVVGWSRLSRRTTKSAGGTLRSVYQHESTKGTPFNVDVYSKLIGPVLTIENVLASMLAEEEQKSTREDGHKARTPVAKWIHDGMSIERQQVLIIALLKNHHIPRESAWYLPALDIDEPELTAIQLRSYRMKHGQRAATGLDTNDEDTQLREAEIQLRCSEANSGILAVQAASLALSAVNKARDLDYRGQMGITRSQLERPEGAPDEDVRNHHCPGHAEEGDTPTSRKGGLALIRWDGLVPAERDHDIARSRGSNIVTTKRGACRRRRTEATRWYSDPEAFRFYQVCAGTQTSQGHRSRRLLRWSRRLPRPRTATVAWTCRHPAKQKQKQAKKQRGKKKEKTDGWIWLESLTRGRNLGADKMAEYKTESDRVQWFRAEAEMYRWLEQYEHKHAELMRVIERFRRDGEVWTGLGDREEERNSGPNGAATFARMQTAMYNRLEHTAKVIFKSAESGAHHDWVSATTFDELVIKIYGWRDVVFKWMDDMSIQGFLVAAVSYVIQSETLYVRWVTCVCPPCLKTALAAWSCWSSWHSHRACTHLSLAGLELEYSILSEDEARKDGGKKKRKRLARGRSTRTASLPRPSPSVYLLPLPCTSLRCPRLPAMLVPHLSRPSHYLPSPHRSAPLSLPLVVPPHTASFREKDRTQLHPSIASRTISPKALSLMSPADLANQADEERDQAGGGGSARALDPGEARRAACETHAQGARERRVRGGGVTRGAGTGTGGGEVCVGASSTATDEGAHDERVCPARVASHASPARADGRRAAGSASAESGFLSARAIRPILILLPPHSPTSLAPTQLHPTSVGCLKPWWLHLAPLLVHQQLQLSLCSKAVLAAFSSFPPSLGSEGEGSDYIVARCNNQDVDAYRRGEMTGRKLLSCCVLKVGHSSRMETHQTEYRGCDEDATQTHVWICHYIVQRRCYAERFLHLLAFREGGVRDVRRCPCGVFHREYFNFPSIGGLANLESMLVKVLHAMREGVHRIYQSNKNLKSRSENFKTCATSSPVGLEVVEREL